MNTRPSYDSQTQDPWSASSPAPYARMPEEHQIVYENNRIGGVRNGFNGPSPGQRYSTPSNSAYATGIAGYSTVLLPMQSTNQGMAPQSRFQDNTDQVSEHNAQRMSMQRMSIDAPYRSHRTSNMSGIQPTSVEVEGNMGQEYTCQCPVNNPTLSSPSTQVLAEAAFNRAQQYTRIPINGLLNSNYVQPSAFPAPNQNNMPQAQDTGSKTNVNTHMHNIGSSRSHSLSSSYTSSSATLCAEPPSTHRIPLADQRCFSINLLHNICLDATASYIASLPPSRRHHRSVKAKRWAPYSPRSRHSSYLYPNSNLHNARAGTGRKPTLMDNISTISTHLWRRARHDAMAPHRAEADAVREMRDLYAWGELVVRGREMDGLLDTDVDGEMEEGEIGGVGEDDVGSTSCGGVGIKGKVTPLRVGGAAKRICEWMGDDEAWDKAQSVVVDLKGLGKEKGAGAGGWRVVDDGEEESIA